MKAAAVLCLAVLTGWPMAAPAQDPDTHTLPLVLSAGHAGGDSLVRIVNRSFRSGTVQITAIDDAGESFGPVSLDLDATESVNLSSRDLEEGGKGLSAGLGDGEGYWRLELETLLDVAPLAYARTSDGITSMLDVVPEEVTESEPEGSERYQVAFFNPGSNVNKVSLLRLKNLDTVDAEVEIMGRDDAGRMAPGGPVSLDLPAGESRMLMAKTLESGGEDLDGSLGVGSGKWRLTVESDHPEGVSDTRILPRIEVMSLLQGPSGHLSNLSLAPVPEPGSADLLTLPLVLRDSGLVRIINRSGKAGTVGITAIDDAGESSGPVSLDLDADESVNLSARDLKQGNEAKGLPDGLGEGDGNWRLELETSLDVVPLAYARTSDGITSMHDVVPATGQQHQVSFFNPGSNMQKESRLRLVNPGTLEASVTILARDDAGRMAPGGPVSLRLPGGESRTLTAQTLESDEGEGLDGSLGDGAGKWRLFVSNDRSIEVMNLLRGGEGHLANLSGEPAHSTPLAFAGAAPVTFEKRPGSGDRDVRVADLTGRLDSESDVKYHKMTLENPSVIRFPDISGVVLTVFDSQGDVVTRHAGTGGAPEGVGAFLPLAGALILAAGEYVITVEFLTTLFYAGIIVAELVYIAHLTELELIWGEESTYDLNKMFQGERTDQYIFSFEAKIRTRYGEIALEVGADEKLRATHTPAKDAPCGTGSERTIKFPVTFKVTIPAVGVENEKATNFQVPVKITRENAPKRKEGSEYAITVTTDERRKSWDQLDMNDYVEDPEGGVLDFAVYSLPHGWRVEDKGGGVFRFDADPIADDGQATLTATEPDGECWNFPIVLEEEEVSDEITAGLPLRR